MSTIRMRGRGAPQLAGLVPAPLAVLALFTVLALFAAAAVAPAPAPASSVTPAVTPAGTWKLSSGRVYRWVALPGGVFEEQSMTSHTLAKSSCTLAAGTAVFRYKPVGGGVFAVYARRWTDACVASWEGEPKELLKIAVGSGRLKLSCDRAYTKACYSYTRVAAKPAPVRASTPAGTWKRDTGGTYRWVKRGSTWEETTLTSYTATGTKCRVAAGTLVYRYVPAGKGAYREQRRTWTKACRTGWKAGELLRLTPDASWLMHVQAADAADVWAGYARPGATPLPPSAGSPLGTWRIVAGRLYQWVAFGSGGFDELSLTPQRTDKGNCLIPRGTAVSRYTPLGGGVYDVSYRYWSDNCKTIAWDPPEERIKLVVRGNRLLFSCDRSYGELCWVGARVSG